MKIRLLAAGLVCMASLAGAETLSEVCFPEMMDADWLTELAGEAVTIRPDGVGGGCATLSDNVVRQLAAHAIPFEVLWTRTTASDDAPDKAESSISAQNLTGFAINPVNSQTLNISGAPPGAVVTTVTLRVAGTAPYADLCTFQLRDGSETYTLPTWYDEFSFNHTVSGITAFAGRPVNQAWSLWGQGSNTSGERVDQWWLTIYYNDPEPDPTPGVRIAGPRNVEFGATVTLVAETQDLQEPITYQWHKDGAPIADANGAEYVISGTLYGDAGEYMVSVVDGSASSYESPLLVLHVWPEGSMPLHSSLALGILLVAALALLLPLPIRRGG